MSLARPFYQIIASCLKSLSFCSFGTITVKTHLLLTCLSRMKSYFAFVTVLKNQTLIPKLDWGTFFDLYLSLGLLSKIELF